MSVTIVSFPEKITPAFNPMLFGVSSPSSNTSGFKYVVEVKDGAGVLLARKKIVTSSTPGEVTIFDVSNYIKKLQTFNHWRYDVTGANYIYHEAGFVNNYQVYITESIDGVLVPDSTSFITSLYTIPAALHSIKFPSYDYDAINSGGGRWLTNFETFKVRSSDKLTLSYLTPETGVPSWRYEFFDASGNTLGAATKVGVLNTIYNDVVHVHAGLTQALTYSGLSIPLTSIRSYTIKPSTGLIMPFKVVCPDTRFPGVRVHYLNEWGAVDSFLFNLASRRGATIEKKKIKTRFEGSQLRPSAFGIGSTPYIVKYTDNLKITSDYISDNDSNSLLEMFSSPIVSVETEKSLFYPASEGQKLIIPCEIDLSNYDIKQSKTDKLFNIELEVKISVDNTRQTL